MDVKVKKEPPMFGFKKKNKNTEDELPETSELLVETMGGNLKKRSKNSSFKAKKKGGGLFSFSGEKEEESKEIPLPTEEKEEVATKLVSSSFSFGDEDLITSATPKKEEVITPAIKPVEIKKPTPLPEKKAVAPTPVQVKKPIEPQPKKEEVITPAIKPVEIKKPTPLPEKKTVAPTPVQVKKPTKEVGALPAKKDSKEVTKTKKVESEGIETTLKRIEKLEHTVIPSKTEPSTKPTPQQDKAIVTKKEKVSINDKTEDKKASATLLKKPTSAKLPSKEKPVITSEKKEEFLGRLKVEKIGTPEKEKPFAEKHELKTKSSFIKDSSIINKEQPKPTPARVTSSKTDWAKELGLDLDISIPDELEQEPALPAFAKEFKASPRKNVAREITTRKEVKQSPVATTPERKEFKKPIIAREETLAFVSKQKKENLLKSRIRKNASTQKEESPSRQTPFSRLYSENKKSQEKPFSQNAPDKTLSKPETQSVSASKTETPIKMNVTSSIPPKHTTKSSLPTSRLRPAQETASTKTPTKTPARKVQNITRRAPELTTSPANHPGHTTKAKGPVSDDMKSSIDRIHDLNPTYKEDNVELRPITDKPKKESFFTSLKRKAVEKILGSNLAKSPEEKEEAAAEKFKNTRTSEKSILGETLTQRAIKEKEETKKEETKAKKLEDEKVEKKIDSIKSVESKEPNKSKSSGESKKALVEKDLHHKVTEGKVRRKTKEAAEKDIEEITNRLKKLAGPEKPERAAILQKILDKATRAKEPVETKKTPPQAKIALTNISATDTADKARAASPTKKDAMKLPVAETVTTPRVKEIRKGSVIASSMNKADPEGQHKTLEKKKSLTETPRPSFSQVVKNQENVKKEIMESVKIPLTSQKTDTQQNKSEMPSKQKLAETPTDKKVNTSVEDTLKKIQSLETTISKEKALTEKKVPAKPTVKKIIEKRVAEQPAHEVETQKPSGPFFETTKTVKRVHAHPEKEGASLSSLSTRLDKYKHTIDERQRVKKIKEQAREEEIRAIVVEPENKINMPLLAIAIVVMVLTTGSGYYYYKYAIKNEPIKNLPFIPDVEIDNPLSELMPQQPEKTTGPNTTIQDAATQQFDSTDLQNSIKEYIATVKEDPRQAVELRNGYFIQPQDKNNIPLTTSTVLKSFGIDLSEAAPLLDGNIYFFIIRNQKKKPSDPVIVKLNFLIKTKSAQDKDALSKEIKSLESVLPSELRALFIDENAPVLPPVIEFKSLFTKSRVSSEIRYFNYAPKDSTKAVEWGLVSVNGSKYLVISTSKRSTDAMILNFE